MPSRPAASATPCAWLPALAATTPRVPLLPPTAGRSARTRPRTLYEPARCRFSHLSQAGPPSAAVSGREGSSGVVRMTPASSSRAARTSARPTSSVMPRSCHHRVARTPSAATTADVRHRRPARPSDRDQAVRRRLRADPGVAGGVAAPRGGHLELPGHAEQQQLRAGRTDQLHGDRQAVRAAADRHDDRRQAGDVPRRGVRGVPDVGRHVRPPGPRRPARPPPAARWPAPG